MLRRSVVVGGVDSRQYILGEDSLWDFLCRAGDEGKMIILYLSIFDKIFQNV